MSLTLDSQQKLNLFFFHVQRTDQSSTIYTKGAKCQQSINTILVDQMIPLTTKACLSSCRGYKI